MTTSRTDVLIAGAGFPGLALAIALRQSLGETFAVTVADPALARESRDPRASAIAASARRMLDALGVWDDVAADAQPILDMAVTDSRLGDAVRPTFLTFAGEIEEGEPFAHMVENPQLTASLIAKARALGVTLLPTAVETNETVVAGVRVSFADGTSSTTRLLVAADGAQSRIRERAGIACVQWSYPQSGIVTTIAHERDHEGRALEHFLPAGPFATLPLKNNRASIVWTEESREAARIVALPDAEFLAEFEKRFGLELGDITLAGPRRAFPLGFALARSFIAERIALIGDAAHVIHPIAGQGLNMGLRDAAALAEAIADAARLGLDVGGATVLERYQRWRRFDSLAMGAATDSLNRLFSNNSDVLKAVRDFGLGVVDRLPALKTMFIREAAGLTGDVPKLLRGEAI
ncbi:2-octaprenylphenol hydroxylase [Variibacter gotjawalensis]|uniref:2-octaprenylphenol hydroxylase n=1 Tax=Variibacter gotjawalensis TaxID=1333996 RepID=A0A0S3PQA5_9BRAD|nr:ubiquinone biosynthesis hydroxylase [Variibacter gotjawalensis]NIK48423.1 2-octaprenyl-6-methoxyphenol hydroxylase [Variibacter gotjawalensis]RZS50290.1 2-octaprenyl-6-methoxyphenol hydroxylase [Variibacter gotjawalensis]BAT58123.1 2-octaprenylphenol hydroxylase [Variibacter gotjawalensis]